MFGLREIGKREKEKRKREEIATFSRLECIEIAERD
jgi:hypothetical protein